MEARQRHTLIGAAAVILVISIWLTREKPLADPVVAALDVPSAEKRLTRVRQIAATVPGKQQALLATQKELSAREARLLTADTPAQAQAQLLQILRRLAQSQNIDLRNTEIGQVKPYGQYGQVAVSANLQCGIEQLLNLLADLTAQKELIATDDLRVSQADPKQKTMPVRITISGLVRRELLPKKAAL